MHYMAINPPSAEVYQKLIQSCKYFCVKNSHFATLDHFNLDKIPEVFDIESYDTEYEGYKARLEAIIDEISEATNREYKIPYISFKGLDEGKL
uniref:Uncharacterized protein n=1 Tax=Panagrolaimus sp. ES5 TaxID=591445 RepID=A0AC34G8Q8_9BILA